MIDIRDSMKGISYRIVEEQEKRITILCKKKEYLDIEQIFIDSGYSKLIHPYSRYYGYKYEYQLSDILLYSNQNHEIEVVFEIPCMSLTPNVLLPLDKMIQEEAWDNPCVKLEKYYINDMVYMVYIISKAIFIKKEFEKSDQEWLIKYKKALKNEMFYKMLKKVFFRFADVLIEMIEREEFSEIYQRYISFCLY